METVRNVARLMATYTKSKAQRDPSYYIDERYLK